MLKDELEWGWGKFKKIKSNENTDIGAKLIVFGVTKLNSDIHHAC